MFFYVSLTHPSDIVALSLVSSDKDEECALAVVEDCWQVFGSGDSVVTSGVLTGGGGMITFTSAVVGNVFSELTSFFDAFGSYL